MVYQKAGVGDVTRALYERVESLAARKRLETERAAGEPPPRARGGASAAGGARGRCGRRWAACGAARGSGGLVSREDKRDGSVSHSRHLLTPFYAAGVHGTPVGYKVPQIPETKNKRCFPRLWVLLSCLSDFSPAYLTPLVSPRPPRWVQPGWPACLHAGLPSRGPLAPQRHIPHLCSLHSALS